MGGDIKWIRSAPGGCVLAEDGTRVCSAVHDDSQVTERPHDSLMEVGDALRYECDGPPVALARLDDELVIDEVEPYLEEPVAIWNRRRGQAARGEIQRDVPPVVRPWRQREADLTDHLHPHMKRRVCVGPCIQWQRWPLGFGYHGETYGPEPAIRPQVANGDAAGGCVTWGNGN
jgi:hypothetical protein